MERIYSKLKNASEALGHFAVYDKSELTKKFQFGNNRRIMPIVLVADSGYVFDYDRTGKFFMAIFLLIYTKESFQLEFLNFCIDSNATKFGVHGYDNDAVSMRAFFLANGPAFKSGFQQSPFNNTDVYPLMCNILGLNPSPNNGSLASVISMLKDSGPSDPSSALSARRINMRKNFE